MLDVFEKHLNHKSFLELAQKAITQEEQIAFCVEFLDKNSPELLAKNNEKEKHVTQKPTASKISSENRYESIPNAPRRYSEPSRDIITTFKLYIDELDQYYIDEYYSSGTIQKYLESRIKYEYPEFIHFKILRWQVHAKNFMEKTIMIDVKFTGYF